MATIVTRETTQTDGTSPKGSPLTNAEVDTNFINLNDDKVEVSGAIIFEAKAAEALSKGDVVYVSGVSGNTPEVSKADADNASKMPAYGLAEADASLNAAVNVVTFGTLYDLDTSGFSAGDTVYVSTTAGSLTSTKPSGESSLIQNVGTVIRSHASAGSIKVGGAGRTNDTPNLNDGNVFIGNASNQVEARALTGDDISGGTITSFASTGIDDNATATRLTVNNGFTEFDATYHYLKFNGSTDSLDIGTTSTGYAYFINNGPSAGTGNSGIAFYDNGGVELWSPAGDAITGNLRINSSGVVTIPSAVLTTADINGGTADGVTIGGSTAAAGTFTTFTSTGIDDNATSTAITIDSSGNVGIGENSPSYKLHIKDVATNPILALQSSTTGTPIIFMGDTADVDAARIAYDNTNDLMYFSVNGNQEALRITSSKDVGVGTTDPQMRLHVAENNSASTTDVARFSNSQMSSSFSAGAKIYIGDDTLASRQLEISLEGNGSSEFYAFLRTKEPGGLLALGNANDAYAVTLDGNGDLGVGNSSPSRRLELSGNNNGGAKANYLRITDTDTSATLANQQGGIEFYTSDSGNEGVNASMEVVYAGSGGGGSITFNTAATGGVGVTERMRILSDGGLTFNGDTSTNNALNDYEEGTYTVRLYDAGSGGNASVGSETGYYTKIGRVVTVNLWGFNNIDTTGLTSGNPVYFNLPFTSGSTGRHVGQVNHHGFTYAGNTNYQSMLCQVTQSASRGYFVANGYGFADASIKVSDISSGADDIVTMSLTYHV